MRGKTLGTGENVPDCHWLIRLAMHHITGLAFWLLPGEWLFSRKGRRHSIAIRIIAAHGWWADSHRSQP